MIKILNIENTEIKDILTRDINLETGVEDIVSVSELEHETQIDTINVERVGHTSEEVRLSLTDGCTVVRCDDTVTIHILILDNTRLNSFSIVLADISNSRLEVLRTVVMHDEV